MIGILAYGFLIPNPGDEIQQATVRTIEGIQTPFEVEYARSSSSRAGAPTLVPVEPGHGGRVNAQILVLREDVTLQQAMDMLYRRELDKVRDKKITYALPKEINENQVLVKQVDNFVGVEIDLYTSIGSNLPEILDLTVPADEKARILACMAIESLTKETFDYGREDIQYLSDNLFAGIETPLSKAYENAVLKISVARRTISKPV